MEAVSLEKNTNPSSLTDEEWLSAILASIGKKEYFVGDMLLPSYPSNELSTITTIEGASENMMRAAFNLYTQIKASCKKHGHPLTPETTILDFGCGWGRIARFFTKDTDVNNIHGVDVLPELTNACNETYRTSNFQPILQQGELPHDDQTFDLIFANSVFSHLSEELNLHWIDQIHRVLKPGGLAMLTVIDESKFEKMSGSNNTWFNSLNIDIAAANDNIKNGKFVWQTTNQSGELEGYGLAIVASRWIKENWDDKLNLLEINDQHHQSIIVLQKS